MTEDHPLEVRVGVVLAGEVVAVVESRGCEPFEPGHDVLPQPGLVIVHEYARGDVHRAREDEAVPQLRRRAHALDLGGDVADLVPPFGTNRQILGLRDHRERFPTAPDDRLLVCEVVVQFSISTLSA